MRIVEKGYDWLLDDLALVDKMWCVIYFENIKYN